MLASVKEDVNSLGKPGNIAAKTSFPALKVGKPENIYIFYPGHVSISKVAKPGNIVSAIKNNQENRITLLNMLGNLQHLGKQNFVPKTRFPLGKRETFQEVSSFPRTSQNLNRS